MRQIRVAAQIHPQHGDYPNMRRAVVRAEKLRYDIAYTWDHFFPLYGEGGDDHLECWSLLAAWAEATDRIELGPLVACNSYRNPNLLADIARTIDRISGGRVILGVGSGWRKRDYDEYGYEFGTAATRLEALGAALPIMRSRIERLTPPPMGELPILVAGGGPKVTTRLVARYADAWHAGFPDSRDELLPSVAALKSWCAEIGRDPASIEWSVGVEPYDLDRFLADDADYYVSLGFTQFTLGFNGPEWSVDGGGGWIEWRDRRNAARKSPPRSTTSKVA